ncbi:hypothetical protein CPB85DRAFT_1323306 [Mucidula mucida]|nr:hypothetical protein CPB85DRAFT_1323306 [Mucidula mucida]
MLHPKVLILMSRTNQEYRNFLISADIVWKQSRLRIGMPDLEAKDITERKYILLMFDKACHGKNWRGDDCSQLHVQDMDWISCARLCASCRRSTKMTKRNFRRYIESLHPSAEDCAKDTGQDALDMIRFVQKRLALKACIAKDAQNIGSAKNPLRNKETIMTISGHAKNRLRNVFLRWDGQRKAYL